MVTILGICSLAIVFTTVNTDARASCDHTTVLVNCNQTALDNFEDGTIDHATLIEFQNTHCPAAAQSCREVA